jgi:ribose transport system substrate-binding protein
MSIRKFLLALLPAASLILTGCGQKPANEAGGSTDGGSTAASGDKPTVAFVTNCVASFWNIAKAGVLAGGKDFDANVEVKMPPSGDPVEQQRIMEELLAKGVTGIAISPIDPASQKKLLNEAAGKTNLITQDSDAPDSDRLCYVGMDNYTAGRMCGDLVREALPDGGKIMIFVGRLGQDNAKYRRQGVIDAVLGREPDSTRYDEPGQVIKNDKYEIIGTRTDNMDEAKAKSNAEDTLAANPDIAAMVGLFAYNPPACISAVKAAGKLGKVQIIGFDEQKETLDAIREGHCIGTVVQDPYRYGYESVRILAALARGDKSVIPESGFVSIPAKQIRKADVDAFQKELEENIAKGSE